jgi:HEAT repeats
VRAVATGDSAFMQLDLFASGGDPPSPLEMPSIASLDPARLSDGELIAAIPRAGQREAAGLVDEAVRRNLMDGVVALETLCRRFTGFGVDRAVVEQVVALRGLAAIGGTAAAEAVTRLIVSGAVQGPGLRDALGAGATLGCRLPSDRVASFLSDNDPVVREAACRCARGGAGVIPALIDLLADLHVSVAQAAALALGRLGRVEARPLLRRLLTTAPTPEVVRTLGGIADDDDWVQLARTAARFPALRSPVLTALEESDSPRAATVAEGLRRRLGSRSLAACHGPFDRVDTSE